MRFVDRENPAILPEKPWWALHASTIWDPQATLNEDALIQMFETEIEGPTKSLARMLDNMFFWEPAREALENGGCRQ